MRVDSVSPHLSQIFPLPENFLTKLAIVGAMCHASDGLIVAVFSHAEEWRERESFMCCSRSFQILPIPHLPAQLILSLGYYQEGAWQSSMTEKRSRTPRPRVGINLFDKISHKRFAWLSFSWMLPLPCISEGVKNEHVSNIMQTESSQNVKVSSDRPLLMCWKHEKIMQPLQVLGVRTTLVTCLLSEHRRCSNQACSYDNEFIAWPADIGIIFPHKAGFSPNSSSQKGLASFYSRFQHY